MKLNLGLGFGGFCLGTTAALLAPQLANAATTQITAIEIKPVDQGIELILKTEGGDRPQLFTVGRGNTWIADVIGTQLQLGTDEGFRQTNPAPNISEITVAALDANSVRITVTGTSGPVKGSIVRFSKDEGLVLGLANAPASSATAPGEPNPSGSTLPQAEVLVPNPEVTVNGVPVPARPATPPPSLSRAVPPPVGDIAVAPLNTAPSGIKLDSTQRIPRLVLREAPSREVLSLLAREAGLNLVYVDGVNLNNEESQRNKPLTSGGPPVTLDIVDEPVEDVFNYVLRITGLQANRSGRTIFVSPRLPDTARNLVARSLRLNQVNADAAAAFLATQGAAVQQIFTPVREIRSPETGAIVERIAQPAQLTALSVQLPEGSEAAPLLLRGLSVTTDERLNQLTVIGEPDKVRMAASLVSQLDARRRQVAVNVKVIDVNLLATDNFSTSFSFGVGDTFFSVDGGQATVTSGRTAPPSADTVRNNSFNPPIVSPGFPGGTQVFLDPNNPNNATIFPPGGDPTRPGVTEFTADFQEGIPVVNGNQQLVRPSQDAPVFFDTNGVPRRFNELTVGGGNFIPFDSNSSTLEPDLVSASQAPDVFLDASGVPRRLSELSVGGGIFQPLLQAVATELEFEVPGAFQLGNDFLLQLRASIVNSNAKILTDPTIVVQEGQSATVKLTEQVVSNFVRETQDTGDNPTTTITIETADVGLTLAVRVERIDDNGFITMSVEPVVSSIAGNANITVDNDTTEITLIAQRSLSTGQVRLRDSQTLILSGIIQEQDRKEVTKVPLLGDLPIIGSLFRNTRREKQRAEVIVLVTPQILDDSAGAGYGYDYRPSPDVQKFIEQRQPR